MSPEGSGLSTATARTPAASFRVADVGKDVSLAGWVNRRRDMGRSSSIDLRDRHGLTQVVIDATESPDAHKVVTDVRTSCAAWSEAPLRSASLERRTRSWKPAR